MACISLRSQRHERKFSSLGMRPDFGTATGLTRGNNKTSEHCARRGKTRTIVMNACMTEIE